jgi:hypothetical protein
MENTLSLGLGHRFERKGEAADTYVVIAIDNYEHSIHLRKNSDNQTVKIFMWRFLELLNAGVLIRKE